MNQPIGRVRAYAEVESIKGKKDPNARYAKQVMGLVKGEGRVTEYESFINLEYQQPLAAGDYDVVPKELKLTKDGKPYVSYELVPVKTGAKAA